MIHLQLILNVTVLIPVIYVFLRLLQALASSASLGVPFSTGRAVRRRGHRSRWRGRIRRVAPGRFMLEEAERRPRGKPQGSSGAARSRPPSWDVVRVARPQTCYWCGETLSPQQGVHKTQDRVVIDLEKVDRGLVGTRTLWKVRWLRCPGCRQLVSGGDLVNAPKHHRFGYGMIAYAIHHRVGKAKQPTTKIAYGLGFILEEDAPTAQTVRDWLGEVAGKNRELFKELLELARREGYLEVDESGMPMDGSRWWMWVISARAVTLYLASHTRGHKAVEGELSDYVGTLVVDFWKAYDQLPQAKQRCLIHLLREVTDLLLKRVKAQTKLEAKLERSRWDRKRKAGEKSGRGRPKRLMILSQEEEERVRSRIREHREVAEALYQLARILLQAMGKEVTAREAKERLRSLLEEHQEAKGLCPHYRRIGERMISHVDELFRFLEEPGVESYSTNRAERRVKEYAELRRAIPCWRSPESADDHAQLLSYMVTWSLAELDPWDLSLLLARGEWETVNLQIHRALDKPPPGGIQPYSHPVPGGAP